MFMKKLIVNADDFGLHKDINKGIIKGFKEGFITSTSLMTSAPAWEDAVNQALENKGLGVGIHLTLVGGVKPVLPVQQVPTLVDERGLFLSSYVEFAKRYYTGGVARRELELELRAQLERGLDTGLLITHIDSHQHTHVLPGVNSLVLKLGIEYNIRRVRVPWESIFFTGGFKAGVGRKIGRNGLSFCAAVAKSRAKQMGYKYPDHFFGMLAGGNLNPKLIHNIISNLPEGVSEIMTHPGLNKVELGKLFSWNYHWEEELSAYLDIDNKVLLQEKQIELINFGDII